LPKRRAAFRNRMGLDDAALAQAREPRIHRSLTADGARVAAGAPGGRPGSGSLVEEDTASRHLGST
jgi:hypothetical protein